MRIQVGSISSLFTFRTPRFVGNISCHRFLRFIPMLLVALLAGCAGEVRMLKPISEETPLDPQSGIVTARVINASSMNLPLNFMTITPENVNESDVIKPLRLENLPEQLLGSTVFASAVDPGRYALDNLRAFYTVGEGYYSHYVSAGTSMGVFEVKPGQITDLGTLVYYRRVQDDRYLETLLRVPDSVSGEVLQHYVSHIASRSLTGITWEEDDREEDRTTAYLAAVQNPITQGRRYLAPDGSLLFLTKLGVLLRRTASGEWQLDAVDSNLQLSSAAQNNRGDIAIGTPEGGLYFKAKGGVWRDLSFDFSMHVEELRFITPTTLVAVMRDKNSVKILSGNLAEVKVVWSEKNVFNSITGWKTNPFGVLTPTESTRRERNVVDVSFVEGGANEYLRVSTTGRSENPLFASRRSEKFAFSPTFDDLQLITERSKIDVVIDLGRNKLGIEKAGFWSWSGKDRYFQFDSKQDDWVEIATFLYTCNGEPTTSSLCPENKVKPKSKKERFNLLSVPFFRTKQEAIAIVNFPASNSWTADNDHDPVMLVTSDGGNSWRATKNKLPKKFCTSLIHEVSDRLLLSCSGATGDFFESMDLGETWEQVRFQENF